MSVDFSSYFHNVCNSSANTNGDRYLLLPSSLPPVNGSEVCIQSIIDGLTQGMDVSEVESPPPVEDHASPPGPQSQSTTSVNCDPGSAPISSLSQQSLKTRSRSPFSSAKEDEVNDSSLLMIPPTDANVNFASAPIDKSFTNACDEVKLGSSTITTATLDITGQSVNNPFHHYRPLDLHEAVTASTYRGGETPSLASFISSSSSSSSSSSPAVGAEGPSTLTASTMKRRRRMMREDENSVVNGEDRSCHPKQQRQQQSPPLQQQHQQQPVNTAIDDAGVKDDEDSGAVPEDENGNAEKPPTIDEYLWRPNGRQIFLEDGRESRESRSEMVASPSPTDKNLHSHLPSSTETVSSSEPTTNEVVHDNLLFSAQRKKSNLDGKIHGEEEEEEESERGEEKEDIGEKNNDVKSDKCLAALQIHFSKKVSDSSNRSFAEEEEEEIEEEAVDDEDDEGQERVRDIEEEEEDDEAGSSRRMSDSDDEMHASSSSSPSRKMMMMVQRECSERAGVGDEKGLPPPWNLKFNSSAGAKSFTPPNRSVDETPCSSDEEMEDDDTAFDRRYKVSLKHDDDYLDAGGSASDNFSGAGSGGIHNAGSGRRKQKNPVRFDARHETEMPSSSSSLGNFDITNGTRFTAKDEDDGGSLRNISPSSSSSSSALGRMAPAFETSVSDSSLSARISRSESMAGGTSVSGFPLPASAPASPFSVNDEYRSTSFTVFAHNSVGRCHRKFNKSADYKGEENLRSLSPNAPLDLTVHKRNSTTTSPPSTPSSHPPIRRPRSSSSSPKSEIISTRDMPAPIFNPLISPFNVFPAPPPPPPVSEESNPPPLPSSSLPPPHSNLEEHFSRQMFQEKLRRDLLQAKLRSVAHQQKDVGAIPGAPHLPPFLPNPHPLSMLPLAPPPPPPPPPAPGVSGASPFTQVEPLQSFSAPSPDEFFIDGFHDFDLPGEHFKCPYCEIVFTYKTSLYRHIKSFHQIGEVYACDKCGYVSPRKDKFKSHLVVHEREGRVQKHSNNVRHRIKADPLEESYNCLCGYRTWVKSAYDKHVQQHQMGENMGEVPLSCKICGENFKGESELENHMRSHKENSHYLCDICGFASVQMKKVIEHRRTHTGEKPFECKVCSYRCARRDNLMLHYRKRHKTEAVLPRIRQRVRHKTSEAGASSTTTSSSIPAITFPPPSQPPPPLPPPLPQQQQQPQLSGAHPGDVPSSKPSSLQSLLLNAGQSSPINKVSSSSSVADRNFRPPSLLKQTTTPPPLHPLFNPPLPPSHAQRLLNAAPDLPLPPALSQDLAFPSPFSSLPFPLGFNSNVPSVPLPSSRDDLSSSRERENGKSDAEKIKSRVEDSQPSPSQPPNESSKFLANAEKTAIKSAVGVAGLPGVEPWAAMAPIDVNLLNLIQRFSNDEKRVRAIMEAHVNHNQRQFFANMINESAAAAFGSRPSNVNASAEMPAKIGGEGEFDRDVDSVTAASTSSLSSNLSLREDIGMNDKSMPMEVDAGGTSKAAYSTSGYTTPSSLPSFLPPPPPSLPNQYSFENPSLQDQVGQSGSSMNALGESASDPTEAAFAVRKLLQTSRLQQPKPSGAAPGVIQSPPGHVGPHLAAPFFSAQGLAAVPHHRPSTSLHTSKQCSINPKGILSPPEGEDDRHTSTPSPNRLTIVEPPTPATPSLNLASLFPSGLTSPNQSLSKQTPSLYNHNNKLARQLLTNPPAMSSFALPALSSPTAFDREEGSKMAQSPVVTSATGLQKETVSENN